MLSPTRLLLRGLVLLTSLATLSTFAAPGPALTERELGNLASFAKAFGYVRFFYPDHRGKDLDWDKLSVLGLEGIAKAGDEAALREQILNLLGPVAPRLKLEGVAVTATAAPLSPRGKPSIYWQYEGLALTGNNPIYHQQLFNHKGVEKYEKPPFLGQTPPRFFQSPLQNTLRLSMPLALSEEENDQDDNSGVEELKQLKAQCQTLNLDALGYADWRVRVAAVIKVWTVFQHFHPYLDVLGVDWNATLLPALKEAIQAGDAEGEYQVLMRLVAKTQDGHGYVFGPFRDIGGISMRLARAGEALVVSGTNEGLPIKKGDIVESIDGVPAAQVLAEVMAMSPGSPQLSEHRALNQVGFGPLMSTARLGILRDGQHLEIAIVREREKRGYFFNTIPEFRFPALVELKPGIFYVNLQSCARDLFEAKLEQLAKARAVIFDWRADGTGRTPDTKPLLVSTDVIPHLIDKEVKASPMRVPNISQPDRQGWVYRENTWPVKPQSPRLGGKIIFINEAATVSYGETCTAILANYKLATLVGSPTAGTNGNTNFIPLPCSMRVMWTGMDVRKHDMSVFYGNGFAPDVPVSRSVEGIKAGRDEFLEKALELAGASSR